MLMLLARESIMASQESSELLYCYNKGCGVKFLPKDNKEDSCCFHPGNPIFHDAYKGWSCCNKKSIDFNKFLNIQGCTKSFHNSIKPPEPEAPVKPKIDEVYEFKAKELKVPEVERPPFNTPLTKIEPMVSSHLKTQIESLSAPKPDPLSQDEIKIGTSCKNSGCKEDYKGPNAPKTECKYHKGVPVFHEGMKFWSCCNKKTTDFAVFLEQAGCTVGEHVWLKEKSDTSQSNIRYDWHQTGSHVFISVYAKMCDPNKSIIEVNPIRVKMHLEFFSNDPSFDKDLELCGMVDIEKTGVTMMPTKVEVKLKKAEPGSWSRLYIPEPAYHRRERGKTPTITNAVANPSDDDTVDLKEIQ